MRKAIRPLARSECAMRLASTALLLLLANGVFAQTVPVNDRFYQAIRQDASPRI